MRNERIGDYLVSQGLLTEEQLHNVLTKQKESNGSKKFGDLVVELLPASVLLLLRTIL